MAESIISIGLFFLGTALGSFSGAQVWRLRARQLVGDKVAGEAVDSAEFRRLQPLTNNTGIRDRSIDFETGTQLRWYDMIPIVSWLLLKGRSRYSGKPIGHMEFLLEVGGGLLFLGSYLLWPLELTSTLDLLVFVLWLILVPCLLILFAYDARWFLLPDVVVYPAMLLAAIFAAAQLLTTADIYGSLLDIAGALGILAGLYAVLYAFSLWRYGEDRTWIGFGDVKLGIVLAFMLADWQKAFIALFAANLIGSFLVLVAVLARKVHMKDRIPFGPLLILGTLIAFFAGDPLIAWFCGLSL